MINHKITNIYQSIITESVKEIKGTKAMVDNNKKVIYYNAIEFKLKDHETNKFGDETYYVYKGNSKTPYLQAVNINKSTTWSVFEFGKGFEKEVTDKDLYVAIAKMLEERG